jgi:hypothetical protein
MENLIMVNNSNRKLNFNNYQSNGRRATQGNMPTGTINPLEIRTITNTINIDTRFRENYESTSSTNIKINLENIQKRVVSLKLSSIELPMSFYNISHSRNNNTFIIAKISYHNNNIDALLVTLPDGNYELEWHHENKGKNLIESINAAILNGKPGILDKNNNFTDDPTNTNSLQLINSVVYDVDRASGKSIFKLSSNVNNIQILFNVNNKTVIHNPSTITKQQFLGWDIGFRNINYKLNINSSTNIMSEGICMITGPTYGFVSLNDNQSRYTSNFISAMNKSVLDKHIISKINLSSSLDDVGCFKSTSNIIKYNDINQIREYFGPVDIRNLEVKLLDEYGRIIDLNNMDWSMTLVFETLYD